MDGDGRVEAAISAPWGVFDPHNGIIMFTPGSVRGRKFAEFFCNLDKIQTMTSRRVIAVEYLARTDSGYRQAFERDLEIQFLRDCVKRTDLTVVSRTPIQYFVFLHQSDFSAAPPEVKDAPEPEGLVRVDPDTDLEKYRDSIYKGMHTLLAEIRARVIPVTFDGYWEKDPGLRAIRPKEEI